LNYSRICRLVLDKNLNFDDFNSMVKIRNHQNFVIMRNLFTAVLFLIFLSATTTAQPWVQDDVIFNPSGIPSLPFSQPRLADIDNDGDFDLTIGSIDEPPLYFENTGNNAQPSFEPGEDIFASIEPLDAEMGVFIDIDNDGDQDFITGGYTGLNLYLNTGTPGLPEFEKTEGFFDGIMAGQNPVPDLADIDNDGDPDMVLGLSESGVVKIYTNTGTASSATFDENNVYEIGDIGLYAYPVFCDMDDDGDFDLIAGRDAHGFVYYKNTGDPNTASWEIEEEFFEGLGDETYWNSPTLADLTGDNKPDLIFGTAPGPLNYFIQTGTPSNPEWTENTMLFGGVLDAGGASNPCFFDYDGDGDIDLFTGSQLGDIKYYENTGSVSGPAWEENSSSFSSLKHSIYSAVAIGDVNDDGYADAIVGDLSGKLYYHENSSLGFQYQSEVLQDISFGGWSSPVLVDMDNDGDLDIVAGSENGNLHYIENQGTAQTFSWVEIPGFFDGIDVGTNCVPAAVDIDFDDDYDIVCGNLWGDLACFINDAGEWIENTEILAEITGEQNTTPAFADLDNDGDPDLALGQYSGTFSYFRNQYLVTGMPGLEHPETIASTSVYPNPFSESMAIKVRLDHPARVHIKIISIQGTLIYETGQQMYAQGEHQFNWDAAHQPEGVYFIMININGKQEIIKSVKK
jgi:hypothetical protein